MRLNLPETVAEARRILRLAWPVVLTSLNWTLLHLIDVAVVGHAGTQELGYLAASRALTFISIVMGISALSGVLVFTARADGSGEVALGGEYLRQGLLYGAMLGVLSMVALLAWADPLVRAVGVSEDLAAGGAAVVRAMALAYPGQFLLIAGAYFLEGVSRPTRPMIVNLLMLPLNAVLAWAWVGGHLGLPAMGAVGAALATALVSVLGAVGMLAAAWTLEDAAVRGVRDLSRAAWRRAWAGIGALARFGLMPALASGLELAGFSWLIALSTQLGAPSAGAFQAMLSLHNFAFAFALGLGSAAGVRAGNAYGAGEPHAAWHRSLIAAALAALAMGSIGVFYLAAAPLLVAPFSTNGEVVALSITLLRLIAPFMLFDGVQVVFVFALRAVGDQVAAGVNGVIAFFLVTGGLGWWLVRGGVGTPSLAIACAGGMLVAAVLQFGRMWRVSRRSAPRPG